MFRSATELITVSATVQDRQGRAVADLRQQDFTLTEDDRLQEIAVFARDTDTPLSVELVVDVSGSMADKLENVEDALRHFTRVMRSDDEIGLIEFNSVVGSVVPLDAPRERLTRAFDRLRADGGTALFDAVIQGLETLRDARHRKRVLLLLTDGNDTASRASQRDAVTAVIRSEALVYVLGLGHGRRGSFGHADDTVDIGTLRALAQPSGGRAELIENPHSGGVDRVDETVGGFSRELREQYTLGYYPQPGAGENGKTRRLRVTLRNPDYVVRARTAYGAPVGAR